MAVLSFMVIHYFVAHMDCGMIITIDHLICCNSVDIASPNDMASKIDSDKASVMWSLDVFLLLAWKTCETVKLLVRHHDTYVMSL